MDNLAHALVGAAIGRAAAGHRVRHAALLGAVAANAPDWAELFTGWPWPGAVYLAEHRGVTHALVGVAVEVVAVVVAVGVAWGWRHRRLPRTVPRVPWGWLALLVAAAVASHPVMDWQGSYGLRPLLPWSDRWYYGDFVAIVDPVYWIVPLMALAWGAHRHWWSLFGFGVVGVPATVLVVGTALPAPWLKAAWVALALVGAVGWIAHWFGVAGGRRAAGYALVGLAVYAAAQYGAGVPTKSAARREAEARFGPGARWAALTVVGRPFTWEPMFASTDTVAGPDWSRARHLDRPEVQRALRDTRDGRAIGRFARFLTADVDSSGARPVITLRDARFARFGRDSWATVVVSSE